MCIVEALELIMPYLNKFTDEQAEQFRNKYGVKVEVNGKMIWSIDISNAPRSECIRYINWINDKEFDDVC